MTVGQALERAEELRPGSRVSVHTRQEWLREADGMLRERFFKASDTDAFDTVGADRAWDDGLQDEDVLLAPAPFDALYPHLLCAQMDAALGETDRYAGSRRSTMPCTQSWRSGCGRTTRPAAGRSGAGKEVR